jgi:hypothetical protein
MAAKPTRMTAQESLDERVKQAAVTLASRIHELHCYHCGIAIAKQERKNLMPESRDSEGRRKLVCYKCTSAAYYDDKKKLRKVAPQKLANCPEDCVGCREVMKE